MKKTTWVVATLLLVFLPCLFAQQQTADGGYIIGGTTYSYTHGSMDSDFLIYKLDAAGNKLWRKNFGGTDYEYFGQVIQTADGGYAVIGYTYSYTHGLSDFLVYRLDASGAKLWRKNLGGYGYDDGKRIVQTADGGFAVTGDTLSYKVGGYDLLIYRLDAGGNKLWRKNFGGLDDEFGGFVDTTSDGGFLLAGYSYTYTHGESDFLIYRLDAAGNKLWRKNYGGSGYDSSTVVRRAADGGALLAGYSNSYSDMNDFLVYRLDGAGNKLWRKNFGGEDTDHCYDVRQTADGGYLLCGDTRSYHHDTSDYDFLVYRLDAAGNKLWRRNYGGEDGDYGFQAFSTTDGGYLIFGDSDTYIHGTPGCDADLLIYRVDAAGLKLWRKNYGGDKNDYAFGK